MTKLRFTVAAVILVAAAGLTHRTAVVRAAPQVNSQAPKLIDLPRPRAQTGTSVPMLGSAPHKSTRCYTQERPPKGCIYQQPHDVGDFCTCSDDGADVNGQFLE